jgi:hypothetical protein
VTQGHPQAYFDSTEVLAASDALDPAALLPALPGHDGLRVSAIEGLGLVAARRVGDFTHVVTGVRAGADLFDAPFWRVEPGPLELEALETRPADLGFLAEAPTGVATRLLDAALAGPVVFSDPDDERRAAWVIWLRFALPDGAALTFSTAGDDGVRVSASAESSLDAIDATEPCDLQSTLYARVALDLALRGELQEATERLEAPDGVALAVYGGATDLLVPDQLPQALELITELAGAGEVRLAARAAAALPTAVAGTALVLHESPPLPEPVEPEPDEIVDAEVVEDAPIRLDDDTVVEVPFEVVPAEDVEEGDVVVEAPFEVAHAEPVEADEEPDDELPDLDAWSSLLSELMAESVTPDEELPSLPSIDELRIRERYAAVPDPEPVIEPEPEPEPEPGMSIEFGVALEAFARSLSQAPEPPPVEEQEVGMSLAELEASLEPSPEDEIVEEREVGMSLAELEASLKRGEQP